MGMMDLLRHKVPHFAQLVVVDRHCDVFGRVWCVAELVQAFRAQIPQNVCLLSNKELELENNDLSIFVKLANLSVEDCTATLKQDKEMVLAKIPDRKEFDAQLQSIIFGKRGLLAQRLIGSDILYAAARSANRVLAALDSSSESSDGWGL